MAALAAGRSHWQTALRLFHLSVALIFFLGLGSNPDRYVPSYSAPPPPSPPQSLPVWLRSLHSSQALRARSLLIRV